MICDACRSVAWMDSESEAQTEWMLSEERLLRDPKMVAAVYRVSKEQTRNIKEMLGPRAEEAARVFSGRLEDASCAATRDRDGRNDTDGST